MSFSTLRNTAFYLAVAGLLLPGQAKVISEISDVPRGWSAVSQGQAKTATRSLSSSDTHVFTIALSRQNVDQLESHLLSVSTPGHASYGNFVDSDAIASTYGASDAAVDAVTSWLKSSNVVQSYQVNGAYVDLATTVSGANQLFNASYQYYTHAAAADTVKLRTLSYSVPDEVADHVALVEPGNYFGKVRAFAPLEIKRSTESSSTKTTTPTRTNADKRSKTSIDASCETSITASCLKQLYNVGDYTPDPNSGSVIGFGSFLNQSALYSDTFLYEKTNGIPSQNFTVELFDGGVDEQDPDKAHTSEANLDVQNIIGIAHPLPVVEYITGGSPPFVPNIDAPKPSNNQNEPYVPYYRHLLSKSNKDLPQVISNSYGDEEDSVPYNYAVYTCNLIGLIGLRGITILESSGDTGVGSGCLAPDYKTVEFNAIFPATCPYLTSVGGTVAVSPEVAWDGSSGGFSKYFGQPAFQAGAVNTYIWTQVSQETREYYAPYTNWRGRGFPDVSAHSVHPNYQIAYYGELGPSGGTSAAAPVWAGIVGLLNDARLRRGKSTLGWLNPLLYTFGPQVLTDITEGQAVGCNGENTQSGGAEPAGSGVVPGAYWNATWGWDPVTGYGTPNFQKLLKLVEWI